MGFFVDNLTKIVATLLFLGLLTACAGPAKQAKSAPALPAPSLTQDLKEPASATRSLTALSVAREMIGVPYRYGGTTPAGFDCSGLVQYAFSRAGIDMPRTSRAQFQASARVNPTRLQPGDLVFFHLSKQKVSHVGIYESQGRFIHAPSSGKGVSYASMDNPYWQKRLVGAGRIQD